MQAKISKKRSKKVKIKCTNSKPVQKKRKEKDAREKCMNPKLNKKMKHVGKGL